MNSNDKLCNLQRILPIARKILYVHRRPNELPCGLGMFPQIYRSGTRIVLTGSSIRYIRPIRVAPRKMPTGHGRAKLPLKGNISVCCEAFVQSFEGMGQL
jgi:hypothetical protein